MSRERGKLKPSILCGICPDIKCRSKLYFPYFDASIQCTHCGQRHDRNSLQSVQEVSDLDAHLHDMIRNILVCNYFPKRGTETVKVLGLSNYHCKLLSPLLTKYGMDKRTGKAKLLSEMNQGDIFDCGLFGDRAFLIDPEHISVPGFGRDGSGSMSYLSQTLELIKHVNDGEERLLPIHADGDGHCLVHAVSRALVGRELFWHPLRCSLKKHFEDNLKPYQELFKDFVDESDWRYIIDECDPDFVPPEGELLGLRNIHVFGLANVLKRPIILLDSLECMNRLGDYAALFLPSLISPDLCRGKNNRLNKPLCIAWSSPGHNHYIPLVGIKKKPLPVLPVDLLPKAWGVPQSQILTYMEFDEGSFCTIGGDRSLADSYIMRLVSAMEELFLEKYGVHPGLVADVHHYLYQSTGVVAAERELVVYNTKKAVQENRLYRCLSCDAVCEQVIKPQWFRAGGVLYNMALIQYGKFVHNQLYPFPLHGIVCRYDAQRNELQPDLVRSSLESCTWCNGKLLRKVKADGNIVYKNEDKTKTPARSSICDCGYKHYWCGKEYDNPPQKLNVTLEWNNQILSDTVVWFEKESDPSLNSNVYEVATEVVQKHFPGEFGSERLIQKVVEQLLNQTKPREILSSADLEAIEDNYHLPTDDNPPDKIVVSGSGVLHKEELGRSETERQILQRVRENAESLQKRSEVLQKNSANATSNILESTDSKIIGKGDLAPPALELVKVEPPRDKIVRVATSDGRQGKLVLKDEGITYSELQSWIHKEFQIDSTHQRIKYGFPPQELHAPEDGKGLPLSHGDRVIVEMISDKKDLSPVKRSWPITVAKNARENYPKEKSVTDQWVKILNTIKRNAASSEPPDLDMLLTVTTNLSHQLAWNFSKEMPHMFSSGGEFYEQVASDIGLIDQKHYNLPSFPNKVFSYNASTDSLELCVKPYGHFVIDKDIDLKINLASQAFTSSSTFSCQQSFPTLNVPTSTSHESWDQQPHDVGDNKISMSTRSLIRKGPGYSVLGPSPEEQVDKLQILANQLVSGSKKSEAYSSAVPSSSTSRPGAADQWEMDSSCSESSVSYLPTASGDAPAAAGFGGDDGSDPSIDDCARSELLSMSAAANDSTLECDNSEMDCT